MIPISSGIKWMLIIICLFGTGCETIHITSHPSGAKILIDGIDMEEETPASFSVGHFDLGSHRVVVEKSGYKTITSEQDFTIYWSKLETTFSIFPHVLLKNLFRDHWKKFDPSDLKPFDLEVISQSNLPLETQVSVTERLKQLEALKDKTLITEEEYQIKRKAILDKL